MTQSKPSEEVTMRAEIEKIAIETALKSRAVNQKEDWLTGEVDKLTALFQQQLEEVRKKANKEGQLEAKGRVIKRLDEQRQYWRTIPKDSRPDLDKGLSELKEILLETLGGRK